MEGIPARQCLKGRIRKQLGAAWSLAVMERVPSQWEGRIARTMSCRSRQDRLGPIGMAMFRGLLRISMAICIASLCRGDEMKARYWGGILSPERAADWSKVGIIGGIPNRTITYKTLAPGVTAEQINEAIASCPSGQVVYLSPGTYELGTGIDFANHCNVTLRGAGADQTFLVFTGSAERRGQSADICIYNFDSSGQGNADKHSGDPPNTADWTAGYSRGATEITLSNTRSLAVGKSVICLDQLDDSDSDTATVWVSQKHYVSAIEGPGGAGRKGRAQMQMSLVTNIDGNKVTISPGLYMPNWRSAQSPGAWWENSVVSGDGVEDLSIDHADSGAKCGIEMYNAYQCWVKGIRDLNSNRDHVGLFLTTHSVVRDSYFYGTQNAIYLSYGVELFMACDNLIENNIFQHIVSPMITNGCGSGSVWGYNFAVDDYYSASRSWMMAGISLHAAGTDMMLYEGNECTGIVGDYIHGTHNLVTAFRNQLIGWEAGMAKQTIPVQLYSFSRYFNFVGNVLGKPGFHTRYEDIPPAGTNADASIYALGWSGNGGTVSVLKNDPITVSTAMRWGNYDTVTNVAHWDASEVPSGIGQLANSMPTTHSLPPSFYLANKPGWWGTMPWPAIGPDVTGGTDATGHVYASPAEVCYYSCPKDNSYPENISGNRVLIFNAGKHYPSTQHVQAAADTTP